MHWFSAVLGLVVGGLVAGGVVGVGMLTREKIVVDGARRTERAAGVVTCNARVAEITTAHNAAVEKAVQDATAAAQDVTEPRVNADLIALCKASASCRDRGRL